ncbi:NADH-quinone oxidoreductase subunit N [Catalinimonas sp. 4WD22]|jgi:NADH-quinone oxidoreductase subunit N|uniref:NADH-quinone oxidoreductase subunit N n=1 Tax=Catalinimonas locisalis TaxID=3133978 RepID=UPI0031014C44
MSQMARDLILILPQIIVLLTAVVALIWEMFRKPLGSLLTLSIGMIAASILSISRLGLDTTAFSQTFRIDALNHWSVIILCPASVLFALLARSELRGTDREGTVYSLLGFSTLGSLLLAGSGDVMFIVLGILMNSLSGFALAAYPKTDKATEGAMKYFVYGSVTGAIMIFGLTYWVGISGSTLLSALNDPALPPLPVIFGFVTLVVGISYAASIFPFHFWTPDTFEGAPVSIAAYLSVIPKIGAIYALAQVAREIPTELLDWPLMLAILAVLSMTFGNVVALWQQNVIRLLAYSTVAQAGYFLLGVVAMQQSSLAEQSLVIFGIAYAVMNTGAFAIVLANGQKIEDLKGVGKSSPWPGVAMTIFLFSLVGIPPLAGFAGKFLLFGAAIDSQFTWLAIAAILNSVISLAVYLRIIVPMYFQQDASDKHTYSRLVSFVWICCLFFTVAVGLGVQIFL